jgi:hypothetical protein
MRSDITPGGTFLDYELRDHDDVPRRLGDLQGDDPMIQRTLVLKPGQVVHSMYNGYSFWGRPSFVDLWSDLRAVARETRPDWALATPGLRAAWDAGGLSRFHGWDSRAESMAKSV